MSEIQATLHFDGACRGNGTSSADAGCGGVIKSSSSSSSNKGVFYIDLKYSHYMGKATNNEAEYEGLIKGLELAARHGITDLEVKGDSELIIRQVSGKYKVKSPNLKPLHAKVIDLKKKFKKINFTHVFREFNRDADTMANESLNKRKKDCFECVKTYS